MDQNNGKTISFTWNTSIKKMFSFEKLKHNFPKKIKYQKLNENKIDVHILGSEDNGFKIILLKQ